MELPDIDKVKTPIKPKNKISTNSIGKDRLARRFMRGRRLIFSEQIQSDYTDK